MTSLKLFRGLLVFGLLVAALAVAANFNLDQVQAQTIPANATLSGYAWSSNIGWIKMRSDASDARSFGVSMQNGVLSGYGWSPHVGWLRFEPTFSGTPTGETGARVSGSNVIGWARFCSVFATGCSGALKASDKNGGWDGWLKLGGGGLPGGGVKLAGGNSFAGYAWGSENVGWVDFSGVTFTEGFIVGCSVNPTTILPGGSATWTASVTGAAGPLTYRWSFPTGPQPANPNLQSVTLTYPTLGTYSGTVTVTDTGNSKTATCQTQLNVGTGNTGPFKSTIRIVGAGTVSRRLPTKLGFSNSWIKSNLDPNATVEFDLPDLYPLGTHVQYYAFRNDEVSGYKTKFVGWEGTDFDPWAGTVELADSGSASIGYVGDAIMNQDRVFTATFALDEEITQKFEISGISYGAGSNSMRVNYQTQELDAPHDSTKATITLTRLDPSWTGTINFDIPITALTNKPVNDNGADPAIPTAALSVMMDEDVEVVEIYLHFATDGEIEPGIVSPYAGSYQFDLTASAEGALDQTGKLNFNYLDLRETEQ